MLNRKILVLIGFFIVLNACSTNLPSEDAEEEPVKRMSTLDTAKIVAASIFSYVEQADTGLITKKQLDKVAKPLQEQLDSMRLLLQLIEIKELDDYRAQLVNKMVDRKVKRKQK